MIPGFTLPPSGFGPGSQPGADEDIAWLPMPSGMRTFAAHLPEIDDPDSVAPALTLLQALAAACDRAAAGETGTVFDLTGLDPRNRALIAETLGEGEVSIRLAGTPEILAQEAVFAGVWVLKAPGLDRIEVAPVPAVALARAFVATAPALGPLAPRVPGVVNAPPLVVELMDRSRRWAPGAEAHVVNLSLLPHTPEDLEHLDAALGRGSVAMLSRGYGNCRVTATALPQVWRVQFFNSMDVLILDSFEVTRLPDVAAAAPEDFEDSALRLREVLEAVR